MFRFTRSAAVRTAAGLPVAMQFAQEVTTYVNKQHGVAMRWGVESYGSPRIHWHFDIDSVDKMQQMNVKLMQDREYGALLAKHQEIWLEGSLRDTLVVFPD